MRPSRLLTAAAVLIALLVGRAGAQTGSPEAQYQLASNDVYAGLPFVLAIVAEGFDDGTAPSQPTLTVPGATITPLGVEQGGQMTVIINGRRMDSPRWLLKYRVEVAKAGTYTLPQVTVSQGGKQAIVRGGRIRVGELKASDDMAIEVALPDRPVYVGETIPAEIVWLLRVNPRDQSFDVPLLGMLDKLQVTPLPAKNPRQVVSFPAGNQAIELGYVQDDVQRGGATFTRLRFPVLITPLAVGPLDVAPAQVVAKLETGMGRDAFGFPAPRVEMFRASDRPRRLDVRPLPETGKPPSFGGAVGSSFSIGVRASRSVVQLGEPVELEITVKSSQRLDTVGLPPLDGPGQLPRDVFVAPSDPPVGELAADGLSKTFKVSVQVVSDQAREIPALAFSYFDPERAAYQTIHSDPIALSVKGGAVVGAAQVVGGGKAAPDEPAAVAGPGEGSLAGVELALSSPGAAGDGPLSRSLLWSLVALLYLVPLGLLGVQAWRSRTAGQREEAGEARAALRALRAEIERAKQTNAKDAAVALPRALRACARALGRTVDEQLIIRIENAGFAPGAGADPLASELRNEVADVADAWARGPRAGGTSGAAAIALLVGLGVLGAPALARADAAATAGRSEYQAALDATDPAIRQRNFAAAATAFARLARERGSAALYTDWGNAALGAGDLGGAALAYRRALAIDATDGRARRNLAWLRGRLSGTARPRASSATETLFFFHHAWSRDRRLLVGAAGFALAVLLLLPWRGRRRAWAPAAVVPALAWLALTVSVLVEDRRSDDAVLMRTLVLRVADSTGAPPALASPLPAGVEVTIIEDRGEWARVRIPAGTTGWVPANAVERVAP